jgi:NarL family two-component system response regulator LiaR
MPVRAQHRILIAHPEPIVRYGLRSLIAGEPDFEVIGEADDGPDAVRMARRLHPDLALIGAIPLVADAARHTVVVVIAGENEESLALAAIRAGAAAYLQSDCQVDDVLRALRGAAAGQVILPQSAARIVHENSVHRLSQREIEVLQLVGRGMSNKQIAQELGITLSTVKSHVSGVLARLELSSRTQLALYAMRFGHAGVTRFRGVAMPGAG